MSVIRRYRLTLLLPDYMYGPYCSVHYWVHFVCAASGVRFLFPLTYSVEMIEEIGREGLDEHMNNVVHSFHHLCDTRRGLVCVMDARK